MLTALFISNIALIDEVELEFGAGLSVLTGETGAGKSVLLDSLGLVLGMRADSKLVCAGTQQAHVTAFFDSPVEGSPLAALLAENGLLSEADEALILRRSLRADGVSRAFVNDRPCSASLLRSLGACLVEIHGQNSQRGLISPAEHRGLLDAFGGYDTQTVARSYSLWRAAEQQLAAMRAKFDALETDRDWLSHCLAELQQLAPHSGEEEQLATERAMMQKGEVIASDLTLVLRSLAGNKGGPALLRVAARRLARIAGDHTSLTELTDALGMLDRAIVDADEAENKLREAARLIEFDPAQLDKTEERLFALRSLARKHEVQSDELSALMDDFTERLDAITGGREEMALLETSVAEKVVAYQEAAETLSDARSAAAKRLDAALAEELVPLRLDAARFQTLVERLPIERWNANGIDRVEFLISTNPGAPLAPLAKIASGGELSRFVLALKVALAVQGGVDTIIFDEIDHGVGGAVASAIGTRLAQLADAGKQLLVVTHSPQVAAKGAAAHYFIAKASAQTSQGEVMQTHARVLDTTARREEIARMLSDSKITAEARAQADRLLKAI